MADESHADDGAIQDFWTADPADIEALRTAGEGPPGDGADTELTEHD